MFPNTLFKEIGCTISKELHGTIIRDIQEGVVMESRQPLFTVVTATLNCAEDACRTAQSVLDQDFHDYEYIVKDGGSIDGTIERLTNMGIKVHVRKDEGVYDAFNQALSLSKGIFVYFLNAGDLFFDRETLKRISHLIDPDTDICCGNLFLLPMRKIERNPERIKHYYQFRKNLNHQSWMARRSLYLECGGFNTDYRFGADQDFLLQAIHEHQAKYQHIDVVFARFAFGGISTRRSNCKDVSRERRRMIRNYYSRFERILYSTVFLHCLIPVKRRIFYLIYGESSWT